MPRETDVQDVRDLLFQWFQNAGRQFICKTDELAYYAQTHRARDGIINVYCCGAREGDFLSDEIMPDVIGPIPEDVYAEAGRHGWPEDLAWCEHLVATAPGWIVVDGGLRYVHNVQASQVTPANSSQVQLLARNQHVSLYSCVTNRSVDEVRDPRFFATIADVVDRFSRIEVVAEAGTPQPVYLTLVIDAVSRTSRLVVTKVLSQVRTERAMPTLFVPALASAAQGRDAQGRFQARGSDAA